MLIPSRRHLLRRALYLLIIVALLSGMGLVDIGVLGYRLVAAATVHDGEQTAQILPPDTDGYFTVNMKPGLDQLGKMRDVLSNWNDNPAFHNQLVELMSQLESETGIDIDIEIDVLPWLGPELAIAACIDPDFMITDEQPILAIIIGTFDRIQSDAFIFNKFLPLLADGGSSPTEPNGSYRDIETLYDPDPENYFYWAFTDEYIIWSQNQARLEAVLDLYLDGGPSLATTANFVAAQAELPLERVAMGYVNVDHMVPELWAATIEQDAAHELANIQAVVTDIMDDNGLAPLPNPVVVATDDMAAFPDTSVCGTDKLTGPVQGGGNAAYTLGGDKDGYYLYQHDLYADGSATADLVNYVTTQHTMGTYTVDTAGTVTQVTTGYEGLSALLESYLPSFAAGSAYFVDDGIKTDYYMPTPAGMAGYPFPGENPLNSAKLVPANALGFLSELDLNSAWLWMKPIIASNWATIVSRTGAPEGEFPASLGEMITALNTMFGFDIEADALSWMNGDS
ncbi:DUF3352 domain-containing protein [Chloroflexota bacterium]